MMAGGPEGSRLHRASKCRRLYRVTACGYIGSEIPAATSYGSPKAAVMKDMRSVQSDDNSEVRLVGTSTAILAIQADIDTAARSDAKVLITGETGVGKEVVAHFIHQRSARRHQPMVTLNCAGVPESLLESELFGHVRGSFTGAHKDRRGLLEMAANGTMFLDEVGEMSLRMQAVLLRFLQSGEIQRVGADRAHTKVNVRLISATNRDLEGPDGRR